MPDLARRILNWIIVGIILLMSGAVMSVVVLLPIAFSMGFVSAGLSIYGLVICKPFERMWYVLELLCSAPWILAFFCNLILVGS